MKKVIEIYTDGSSLGNPGRGGWGVVVTIGEKTLKEFGGYEKNTTNNRMELVAAISALKYILDNHKDGEVIIHTDSSYVLGGVTTWIHGWERNGWKTANKQTVLNQDLWQELIVLVRLFGSKLTWQKVKGHDGVLHNERAEAIATECSSLQRNYV